MRLICWIPINGGTANCGSYGYVSSAVMDQVIRRRRRSAIHAHTRPAADEGIASPPAKNASLRALWRHLHAGARGWGCASGLRGVGGLASSGSKQTAVDRRIGSTR